MKPFYQVGDRVYHNKYLAWRAGLETAQSIRWNFFQQAFDQADWSREPTTSWPDLLDMRAKQIAEMGKPIVLAFSGGSDSLTVYHTFRRCHVPITAVYILVRRIPGDPYRAPVEFMHNESKAHGFTVIVGNDDDVAYDRIYDRDDWFTKNANHNVIFGHANDVLLHDDLNPELSAISTDYVYVTGLEKPKLAYKNNRFVSYQSDFTFQGHSDPRVEYFFTSPDLPELHIKQSYMAARWIYRLHKKIGQSLDIEIRESDIITKGLYLDYAINGCGLVGDINDSAAQKYTSILQHLTWNDNQSIDQIKVAGNHKIMLEWGIQNKKPWAIRYLNGLQYLKNDASTVEMFHSGNDLYRVYRIHSKPYALNMSEIALDR